MSELVPQYGSIEDVYIPSSNASPVDPAHKARWKSLLSTFRETYGHKPDFVARSPGRVNIIGEHVDYSLYNVLPMAVTVDSLIAFRVLNEDKPRIKISTTHPEKYPASEFDIPIGSDVEIDAENHEWTNYFKAGLKGSLQFLRTRYHEDRRPASMEIIVDGNVPSGGGLSSSAALVCASALAVMKANNHDVTKQDLLDLAIVSEREVGVFSGGMDQAASIFSQKDHLLYCRFWPSFHAEHVSVPPSDPEVAFLVAQSLVTSEKAATAPKHYNLRVVEVTLAAVVLAKLHDIVLNPDDSPLGFCLRNFQQEYMRKLGQLEKPIKEQVFASYSVTNKSLKSEGGYTRSDISKILGISVDTLEQEYMSRFPVQADRFMLRQRALHVFAEAYRVIQFKEGLTASHMHTDRSMKLLGRYMNDTQTSCRDLYDCSCPEINEICEIARKAGAFGSRLTGAGWGGCTVHLLPQERVQAVSQALKEKYYFKYFPKITKEKLEEAIVVSRPSQGSSLISGSALDD